VTQDALEAERRNAAEERREQDTLARYAAEFRAQGYGEPAVGAMVRKRFREENRPPRKWTGDHISAERERAETLRKIDTGELMGCPVCKRFVPVSEGVILAHDNAQPGYYYSGPDPCRGEGMLAEEGTP
jgi:hypothetical protein